jgi:uncharacterized protein
MKSTNNDVGRQDELVTKPSRALSRPEVEEAIKRGLKDLTIASEAKHFFSLGITAWNSHKYMEAVDLFRRCVACDSHHADAHFYLGLSHYRGVGVPAADPVQAAKCWRRAAEQGHAQAQNNLGRVCEEAGGAKYSEAVLWYTKAAEQGYLLGQFNLGVLYELGRGVPQDYELAAAWYSKAAEQGYAGAQFNLGGMFRLGRGVRQNDAEAAAWYRKAAEQGLAEAQYNLGSMCTLGQGMPRDLAQAAVWFRRAAALGDDLAQQALETFTG